MKNFKLVLTIGCYMGLVILACEENDSIEPVNDPVQQEPEEDPPAENPGDPDPATDPDPTASSNSPDDISQALLFNNAQLKSGSPPASNNISNLQIDKDTINLWPGIKGRIRIRNLDQIPISSVLVNIPGADSHHEVPIVPEESIDSISVFYVDIAPADLDLPHDGNITISPVDPNGDVIDEFEHPVHIDPPFDENIGAGPNGNDMGMCPPKMAVPYFWIYTTIEGEYNDAPGYPHTGSYEVEGCCTVDDNPKSVPCLGKPPNASVVVDNQYSLTDLEFIKLFGDSFIYSLIRSFNDFSYDESDFCDSKAGYSLREGRRLNVIGTFSYTPANNYATFYNFTIHSTDITLEQIQEVGFFPRIGPNENNPNSQAFINCKYLVVKSETEGEMKTQVFERQPEGEDWFD